MTHIRRQIRDDLVTSLMGLTMTEDRVHSTRARPFGPDQVPALNVLTFPEQSEERGDGILRHLTARVEIYVQVTDGLDDDLDAIAAEVEAALDASKPTAALALWPTAFEVGVSGEGEREIGVGTMTFMIEYATPAGDPESYLKGA